MLGRGDSVSAAVGGAFGENTVGVVADDAMDD
jgi:hypothetical protein